MIEYKTHQNPPVSKGESFKGPSLTRQSDYVSLENLMERFTMAGRKPELFRGADTLSTSEKEQILNSVDAEDLMEEDLSVQMDFLDSVEQKLSEGSKQKEEVKEPTQPEDKKVAPEPAETPDNA